MVSHLEHILSMCPTLQWQTWIAYDCLRLSQPRLVLR
ncbi:hypothetical protein LINGRAHAP2_LOCUS13244 [Linum grandiflorum]